MYIVLLRHSACALYLGQQCMKLWNRTRLSRTGPEDNCDGEDVGQGQRVAAILRSKGFHPRYQSPLNSPQSSEFSAEEWSGHRASKEALSALKRPRGGE
jgi:hypothetical protein